MQVQVQMPMSGRPTDGSPEISVVIPTRNRCARLGRTLGTALSQEEVGVEVVVVDDGSTDATPFWLANVASDRLRVVRLPVPGGLPHARNAGLAVAEGSWIAFLDDDDLWSPRKLRSQLDALAASGAGWTYGSAVYVKDDLSPISVEDAPSPEGLLERLLSEQAVPAGASNVVVRSDLAHELGGFDERLPNMADWDLWLRLAERAPAVSCPDVVVARVQHRDNMHSQQHWRRFFQEFDRFAAVHEAQRAALGITLDERPVAAWLAEASLRAGRPMAASMVNIRDGVRHRDLRSLRRAVRPFLGARRLRRSRSSVSAPAWLAPYRQLGPPGHIG